ncbi:hypothetical protein CVT26_002810 [Gymnopilus dilepis]|uniref:Protein kinase domain-containing protein n=1 Tax=Gymnopilus dilepis TaxID=231916 RepID=A0A409Y398_9AGAR|nr:hypothetical protein CVT26_002810 [Gymnopilus dilepis]
MSISLNCLILGDAPRRAFEVTISKTKKVAALQKSIKEEKITQLRDVDHSDLELWLAYLPIAQANLENINATLDDDRKLMLPTTKLSTIFKDGDPDDDSIHVIVKVPDTPLMVAPGPSDLLKLHCLVLGDGVDRIFTVTIPKTQDVSLLKEKIWEKKRSKFRDIDALYLDLWKVSLPNNNLLETELEQMKAGLSDDQNLSSTVILSTIFQDTSPDHLHIIVKSPYLELNYSILDDGTGRWDVVTMLKTDTVSKLREVIKEKGGIRLQNVAASSVELWSVSFPIEDLTSKTPDLSGPSLLPLRKLSEVFPSQLDPMHIHVVARGLIERTKAPPSAFGNPVPSTNQLLENRKAFCEKRPTSAPSSSGMPQPFHRKQNNPDTAIPCNRPANCSTALPLSLLHPIFGNFADDAENYEPQPDDAQFVMDFVTAMVEIYDKENGRQDAILELFEKYHVPLKATGIGRYQTDGDAFVGLFRYLLLEIKNEVGSTGAEPFFQSSLDFLEETRHLAAQHLNSTLPCLIVLIFGPYIAFAGAAWTDRPTVQMLSPAIPCHYHAMDMKAETMLLRHLGAFRNAFKSLEAYYRAYKEDLNPPPLNPTIPYPDSFKTDNNTRKFFAYDNRMEDRDIFFGRITGKDTPICIKFVTRYSAEGHKFLAAHGLAPHLYAAERLPGGLYMVVMEDVSRNFISLFEYKLSHGRKLSNTACDDFSEKVGECLKQFHQAGFVHGDIRDTNIMVTKPLEKDNAVEQSFKDATFLLVDFDYCGREEEGVRYPLTLNKSSVDRPQEAFGGGQIKAAHDLLMLDLIWLPPRLA